MEKPKTIGTPQCSILLTILTWGSLWGIFEATVGYLLHLLPFSIGWLVWYPTACFFMLNVYRKTQRRSSVILVGLLSASIKMLNLFLPGRIDRVLNPSVSIVFEALSMAAVVWVISHFLANRGKGVSTKALAALCMNTGWRGLYILYILFLVPDWMREISVISSPQAFFTFFLIHNLSTSLVLFMGAIFSKYILAPINVMEQKLALLFSAFSYGRAVGIKFIVVVCLLGSGIALELLL